MPIQNPTNYFITEKHGALFASANAGTLYSGGNQAPATAALASGLTASYTGGLVLYNPIGSTVNLAINYASFSLVIAQTNAAAIGLGVGYSATVVPTGTLTTIAAQPQNVGSATPAQGILYSSAAITLPTVPYLSRILAGVGTGPTSGATLPSVVSNIAGGIILPPGAYCCFVSTAAGTAASFIGEFTWEEPIIGTL